MTTSDTPRTAFHRRYFDEDTRTLLEDVRDALSTNINGVQDTLKTIRQDVVTVQQHVAQIRQDGTSVVNGLGQVQQNVAKVAGDMATVQGDVAQIKHDSADTKTTVSTIDSNVHKILPLPKFTREWLQQNFEHLDLDDDCVEAILLAEQIKGELKGERASELTKLKPGDSRLALLKHKAYDADLSAALDSRAPAQKRLAHCERMQIQALLGQK